jgi:hypothetical protein
VAILCVALNLSKELLESVILELDGAQWIQFLNYENTVFRCRFSPDHGHVMEASPKWASLL